MTVFPASRLTKVFERTLGVDTGVLESSVSLLRLFCLHLQPVTSSTSYDSRFYGVYTRIKNIKFASTVREFLLI